MLDFAHMVCDVGQDLVDVLVAVSANFIAVKINHGATNFFL